MFYKDANENDCCPIRYDERTAKSKIEEAYKKYDNAYSCGDKKKMESAEYEIIIATVALEETQKFKNNKEWEKNW